MGMKSFDVRERVRAAAKKRKMRLTGFGKFAFALKQGASVARIPEGVPTFRSKKTALKALKKARKKAKAQKITPPKVAFARIQ